MTIPPQPYQEALRYQLIAVYLLNFFFCPGTIVESAPTALSVVQSSACISEGFHILANVLTNTIPSLGGNPVDLTEMITKIIPSSGTTLLSYLGEFQQLQRML